MKIPSLYQIEITMNSQPGFLPLFFALLFSCSGEKEGVTISKEANDFLNEVLTLMENNSIKRNEIEWLNFRNQVLERAEAAQSIDETYEAVRLALTLLVDNHSLFRKPDGGYLSGTSRVSCSAETISTPSVPESIGYIAVNAFSGSDDEKMTAFAEDIHEKIKAADNPSILGWIVDLIGIRIYTVFQ